MKTQLLIPIHQYYPNTLHLHFLGICLVFMSACSLLKEKCFFHADSLLRQSNHQEVKQQSTSFTEADRIYVRSDSSDRQSLAVIFPKGSFQYSAAGGFKGEAERVMINVQVKHKRHARLKEQLKQSSRQNTGIKESGKLLSKSSLKEKDSKPLPNNLMFLFGFILILTVFWLYRKFK